MLKICGFCEKIPLSKINFMPLYIPVDFNAAYSLNQQGRLAEDQVRALSFMLKARGLTGLFLLVCDLLMVALFGAVVLAGDWEKELIMQMIFLVFTLAFLVGVIYGWKIWRSVKKTTHTITSIVVEKIVGEAVKYNYGVPVKVMGATHAVLTNHGYVRVDGKKYGVLNPQLYADIIANKKTDFYIAPISSTGFSKNGVVINCSN